MISENSQGDRFSPVERRARLLQARLILEKPGHSPDEKPQMVTGA